ncbi:oxidoreductase [Photobacterium atrarenae]|uniref:Oxidoreductase n=1 Tax=Photobacterium atrarenae TaxID=865757 RepID=A0ABY5GPA7_9GAMM|nr:oxidoreductase [Photobacterium atrarenae]UTV30753.1 oxidoreductase [Photobacterium atrarenae]
MWTSSKHFLMIFALCVVSTAGNAAPLVQPQDTVVLTIRGQIEHTNQPNQALFDRQMLLQLPQATVTTQTPWTDSAHTYEGVLLQDLLHYVGAHGRTLSATALNDYQTQIDLSTIEKYPILLALKDNGRLMRVRDKGPIWIIYPLSEHTELDQPQHHEDMIWQLRTLDILP